MTTASDPAPDSDAGEATLLAGRYQLLDPLGRGGMAVVHRARDQVLQRTVAVKCLHDRTDDDTARARFTGEARTLAGLSHSGLVTVLDAGLAGDHAQQPFLVMEMVEGETLADQLRRGPLGPDRTGSVGVQLAEALAYAHEKGVVHRDVKPGNVLLDGSDRVKLADFGIARLVGDQGRHTRTGTMIGTAAYLSPEQVRGEDATTASDVYALGLVLLEALTGRREYDGSPTEAAFARLDRPPAVPDDLPGAWREVLAAMTALEPDARPAAAEVARRLREEPTTGWIPLPVVDRQSEVEPFHDRAGDAIARAAHDLWRRAQAMEPHERGVALAIGALLLFLLIVGLAT